MADSNKEAKEDKNAPKGDHAPKTGVDTNPQSGTGTGTVNRENSQSAADRKDLVGSEKSRKEEDARQDAKNAKGPAPPVNFTQDLTGDPGNVDLTQGGTLNSDKSVRSEQQRNLDALNERLNATSGPNPMPNRDGNETTKMANNLGRVGAGAAAIAVDANTNRMAAEIDSILQRNRTSFNEDDRKKLEAMRDELKTTGKFS